MMEVIFQKPAERKECSCSCNTCKQMCMISACFPTPDEVENLIRLGYKDKLTPTIWVDIKTKRSYYLVAPVQTPSGCVFLTRDGLCQLHEARLKPLEGRLAIHNQVDNGLREWVAAKWASWKGLFMITKFE